MAAGLSSRMGEWKPVLLFGESTISRHIVRMLKELKIKPIVVVTGYRARELEDHLSHTGVRFVRNERFRENQMFDSVCLGIREIFGECRRILIMPMDIPAISPETLFQVIQAEGDVVRPWYGGAAGHPIIAASDLAARLCRYQGEGGLRGAIDNSGAAVTELMVEDEAVCRDVDTKEEYHALLEWSRRKKKESMRTIYLIRHGKVKFPDGRKRCIGRTDLVLDDAGRRQARALRQYFQTLSPAITAVYASPLSRARETAEILSGQRLPVIIRQHHHLEAEQIDEAAVVFLADKLVLGTRPVSLEERFRRSALKCTHSLEAWKAHEERKLQAFRVQGKIQDTVNQLQRLQAYEIASSVIW